MADQALILYAHGARDPRWAEPFRQIAQRVAALRPDIPVALAFLEHMNPDLTAAAAELARQGARQIRVVPLFFGRGGHLREDFPVQLESAKAAAPDVEFEVSMAAGEAPEVIEALATFALRGVT